MVCISEAQIYYQRSTQLIGRFATAPANLFFKFYEFTESGIGCLQPTVKQCYIKCKYGET